MRPGDYVIYPTADHVTFVWKVTGIYYGALGQEDVVGLASANRNPPTAHGQDVDEMLVPVPLVQDFAFRSINATSGNLRGA